MPPLSTIPATTDSMVNRPQYTSATPAPQTPSTPPPIPDPINAQPAPRPSYAGGSMMPAVGTPEYLEAQRMAMTNRSSPSQPTSTGSTPSPYNFNYSPTQTPSSSKSDSYITRLDEDQSSYDRALQNFTNTYEGIRTGSVPLTPYEQSQLDATRSSFQAIIDEQRKYNENFIGGTTVAQEVRGLSKYSPEMAMGNIFAAQTEATKKIADLNSKMQLGLAEMERGFRESDMRAVKDSFEIVTNAKKDKSAQLEKLYNVAKAEEQNVIKNAQEQVLSRAYSMLNNLTLPIEERQKHIAELITSGQLSLDQVKQLQNDVSAASDFDTTNRLDLMREARETRDSAMDNTYKQAQIEKIRAELALDADGTISDQTIAYAQQYASNGLIPPGLPKGTFGKVAQVAKELPKQTGTIVDRNTGVKSSKVSETLSNAYQNMYSVIELAKELKELDKQRIGGLVGGTVGKIFGSADQQRYLDLREQISDLLARARTGAAMNKSEEDRYNGMLPGRWSEPLFLGPDSQVRIDNFIKNISSDFSNKINSQGLSVYGFSKVKPQGSDREYTVGEIIHNGNIAGRVNPDGTITIVSE